MFSISCLTVYVKKKKAFLKTIANSWQAIVFMAHHSKTHANKVNKTRQMELTMITEVADAIFFFLFQNSVLVISLIFCP